jgi:indolepyruvate ferredoxin oxidoreductase, alpha subunit
LKELLIGNAAVARGVWEAGATVATAYPGTPSTEITEHIAKYEEIYSEWAPNEKVAMEVAIGASVGGARSIVSMKHVGLNVAADPLFTISYIGTNGGLVIAVADDPGMHSSQNEQDTRYYARASHIPLLEPADSQEVKDFTKIAFDLSEEFDTPVILRLTTRISHSQSLVELNNRLDIPLKKYKKNVQKNVMMPAMARVRHQLVEKREHKLAEYAETTPANRIEWGSRKIGIITSGACYQYAKEVVPGVSYLKLGFVNPLPRKMIEMFAAGVEKLYVIEELEPIIEEQIKSWGIKATGKEIFSVQGELSSQIISRAVLNENPETQEAAALPARPPVLCPGCPHRAVFYALNTMKLNVTGDIGCYTLGALAPLNSMDTCICMGASIGTALGMEKARGRDFAERTVAVIGDSTFLHTGINGLMDVVYNQGITTTLILDNSITGMTGHQNHPGTGKNIKGMPSPSVDLVKLVESIGINHVYVVDPFNLEELFGTIEREIERHEPSVIIARRPCFLIIKGTGGKAVFDSSLCTECGKCLKIGCPVIANNNGRPDINPVQCVGCGLCAGVCEQNAISIKGV